jgi:hypothetical protein
MSETNSCSTGTERASAFCVLTARGARTTTDTMIALLTGRSRRAPVHIDIAVHYTEPVEENVNFTVYSAYVGEALSKTCIHDNMYSGCGAIDQVFVIDTTVEAADAMREFLDRLVNQPTPYNQFDIALCALPHTASMRIPDVALHSIDTVFCSQLAVLALRVMTIEDESHPDLAMALSNLNSRCTSPAYLIHALRHWLEPVNLGSFLRGTIQVTSE